MAKIREDLFGVVSVGGLDLFPGDTVPDGVTVGDHVLAGKEDTGSEAEPAEDKPKSTRRTRKTEE